MPCPKRDLSDVAFKNLKGVIGSGADEITASSYMASDRAPRNPTVPSVARSEPASRRFASLDRVRRSWGERCIGQTSEHLPCPHQPRVDLVHRFMDNPGDDF